MVAVLNVDSSSSFSRSRRTLNIRDCWRTSTHHPERNYSLWKERSGMLWKANVVCVAQTHRIFTRKSRMHLRTFLTTKRNRDLNKHAELCANAVARRCKPVRLWQKTRHARKPTHLDTNVKVVCYAKPVEVDMEVAVALAVGLRYHTGACVGKPTKAPVILGTPRTMRISTIAANMEAVILHILISSVVIMVIVVTCMWRHHTPKSHGFQTVMCPTAARTNHTRFRTCTPTHPRSGTIPVLTARHTTITIPRK